MSIPKCPVCNTNKGARAQAGGTYVCGKCHGQYDGHPDEGGDFSDRNPAARMQRQETRRQRPR